MARTSQQQSLPPDSTSSSTQSTTVINTPAVTQVSPLQSFEQLNASGHAHPHSHLSSTPADQSSPRQSSSQPPLYRATTLFRSRPDITESQFYTHWYTVHGPLVAPWALHYGIVEYTQYHTPLALREALSGGRKGGFRKLSPFEACADMYVRDYKDYMAAFHDKYYTEVISKDEDLFVDKGQVGRETVQGMSEQEGQRAEAKGEDGDVPTFSAISTLGVCRSVIRDGKIVVDVPEQVWRVWEEYQERRKKA